MLAYLMSKSLANDEIEVPPFGKVEIFENFCFITDLRR